jgi:DNA processing protein
VIETGVKGGSLHAINAALKDKKPLGCFDYDEQHYLKYENSRGNREFIRKQLAMAIKDKESILGFIRKCVHLEWENLTLF